MKETRLARTQQAAIDSARKQFSLDIARLYGQRRQADVSVKYLIAFAVGRTK